MASQCLKRGLNRHQDLVMKQLSNTPEAVAVITGLRGDALRDHVSSIFGRASRAQARTRRMVSPPRCAQILLQQMAR